MRRRRSQKKVFMVRAQASWAITIATTTTRTTARTSTSTATTRTSTSTTTAAAKKSWRRNQRLRSQSTSETLLAKTSNEWSVEQKNIFFASLDIKRWLVCEDELFWTFKAENIKRILKVSMAPSTDLNKHIEWFKCSLKARSSHLKDHFQWLILVGTISYSKFYHPSDHCDKTL